MFPIAFSPAIIPPPIRVAFGFALTNAAVSVTTPFTALPAFAPTFFNPSTALLYTLVALAAIVLSPILGPVADAVFFTVCSATFSAGAGKAGIAVFSTTFSAGAGKAGIVGFSAISLATCPSITSGCTGFSCSIIGFLAFSNSARVILPSFNAFFRLFNSSVNS